jgi:hypothetical protein
MTEEVRLTNGKRAALALDAIAAYSSSGPESSPELIFFTDFERDAPPGGDQDRVSGSPPPDLSASQPRHDYQSQPGRHPHD